MDDERGLSLLLQTAKQIDYGPLCGCVDSGERFIHQVQIRSLNQSPGEKTRCCCPPES